MDIKNKNLIHIRKGIYSDSPAIAGVHVLSWKESYQNILSQKILDQVTVKKRQKMWDKILSNKNKEEVCFVALSKNKNIIGFIHGGKARKPLDAKDIEIYSLYLLKKFQNKGIGSILFKKFKAQFPNKKIHLWVLRNNPTTLFYEKMGGVPTNTRKMTLFGEQIEEIAYLFN